MSPLLIQEITRRVNLRGTFQAIYTTGILLPKPISICRYHHRLINLKKLQDIRFAHQPEKLSFASWQKLYRLPESPALGMRPMVAADIPAVTMLLTECACS
jgi:glycylpeptide N-tetradecanoyltransferase